MCGRLLLRCKGGWDARIDESLAGSMNTPRRVMTERLQHLWRTCHFTRPLQGREQTCGARGSEDEGGSAHPAGAPSLGLTHPLPCPPAVCAQCWTETVSPRARWRPPLPGLPCC